MYRKEQGYSKFILDLHIDSLRRWGIKLICRTYGPSEIPLNMFIEFLGFGTYDSCFRFFLDLKAVVLR